MSHRSIFRRIVWNWRVHGIPRCAANFLETGEECRRLLWPWQRMGGNGEDAEHYACMVRERFEFDRAEQRDIEEWAKTDPEFAA